MNDIFSSMKEAIGSLDPVAFCENNLTLDGSEFRVHGNGYKPFADIYRYIGIKALEKNSKPIVLVKGRQVGATTMAGALELFFMSSGLFGVGGRPPMRIIHAFPTLIHVFTYAKTKFNPMVKTAKPFTGESKKKISVIESKLDKSSDSSDSLQYKQFIGGNFLRIESTGLDADRLRGGTVDAIFYDECFPYDQNIKTENGKMPIGKLYELFVANKELPRVLTYNEEKDIFEYKKITNAWNRGKRELIEIECRNIIFKCTPDHKLLTNKGWVKAKNSFGLFIKSNKGHQEVLKITSAENDVVYDLEVEDNHNFIILKESLEEGLIAHNCQDIPRLAIANANKLLTTAKYGKSGRGIQVYFGTPKQKGSDYNKIWEKSNKQYYHLGCEHCGEYFPLYTPGSDAWEDIWIEGKIVKCTHCGTLQDKIEAAERGKWIPTVTNEDEYDYIGFHINQLFNPMFDKKTILDDKPINNPLMGERTWNNEVLGEFYSGEGGPITFEEIEQNCKDERKMREGISIKENKLVFAGFDWGKRNDPESMSKEAADAAGGQSFSTAVVLSLDGPSRLSIDFATIIKKNDFEYKKNIIHEIMRKYSVTQAVGDIGYAQDLTDVMQREYNDRFLASNLVSKVNGYIRLNDSQFPKVILAEREYHIQEMFNIMKKGLIRFPFNDWERIAWLIKHCTSMEVKTTFNAVNEPVRRFVKGSDPNDGFMALLNAYIAYKYYISGGFKDQKAGITSGPKDKKPLAIVGNFSLYK